MLRKDGRDVWAVSGGAIVNVLRTLGGSLRSVRLKEDPADMDNLSDGITADRIVPDTHLVPGFWKIDAYSETSRSIFMQALGIYERLAERWRILQTLSGAYSSPPPASKVEAEEIAALYGVRRSPTNARRRKRSEAESSRQM